jgi:hypothetical protein
MSCSTALRPLNDRSLITAYKPSFLLHSFYSEVVVCVYINNIFIDPLRTTLNDQQRSKAFQSRINRIGLKVLPEPAAIQVEKP